MCRLLCQMNRQPARQIMKNLSLCVSRLTCQPVTQITRLLIKSLFVTKKKRFFLSMFCLASFILSFLLSPSFLLSSFIFFLLCFSFFFFYFIQLSASFLCFHILSIFSTFFIRLHSLFFIHLYF